MHNNGITFLVSKIAHIGHHMIIPIVHKDATHFIKAIDETRDKYAIRGGIIKYVIGEGAFKCIKPDLSKRETKFTPCITKKHFPKPRGVSNI